MTNKKTFTIIVWAVIAALFLIPAVLGTLFSYIIGIAQTDSALSAQARSYKQVEYTELTPEQRLEDFDYFYMMIKTSLPAVYEMSESFSYSVLDREQTYRKMVEECSNDYEFMALMFAIINDIPSGHASFALPDYSDYFLAGYFRAETVGLTLTKNLQGKIEAFYDYLCGIQKQYDALNLTGMAFTYYDGQYVCTSGTEMFYDSTILSIDGRDAAEYLSSEYAVMGQIGYDSKNKLTYRASVCLAESGEDGADVLLQLADGTQLTVRLYSDYDRCFSLYYGYFFSDAYVDDNDDELFVAAPDADDEAITVYMDDRYDLAYVMLSSVDYSDGTAVAEKLRSISGCSNIVIDMRGNGGGVSTFWDNYIYPALYKDDAYFEASGIMPDNDYTRGLYPGIFNGYFSSLLSDTTFTRAAELPEGMYDCNNGKYKQYTFSHTMLGDPTLSYPDDRNVYYVVNNYTCSAADEITQMVKSCGLGTVVGTNTKGEGLIFGVCCDWLPNSLLMYMYCPTYVIDSDGVNNTLYGTLPDLWGGTSAEGLIASNEIDMQGLDSLSPQYRTEWDYNYNIILEDIAAKSSVAA